MSDPEKAAKGIGIEDWAPPFIEAQMFGKGGPKLHPKRMEQLERGWNLDNLATSQGSGNHPHMIMAARLWAGIKPLETLEWFRRLLDMQTGAVKGEGFLGHFGLNEFGSSDYERMRLASYASVCIWIRRNPKWAPMLQLIDQRFREYCRIWRGLAGLLGREQEVKGGRGQVLFKGLQFSPVSERSNQWSVTEHGIMLEAMNGQASKAGHYAKRSWPVRFAIEYARLAEPIGDWAKSPKSGILLLRSYTESGESLTSSAVKIAGLIRGAIWEDGTRATWMPEGRQNPNTPCYLGEVWRPGEESSESAMYPWVPGRGAGQRGRGRAWIDDGKVLVCQGSSEMPIQSARLPIGDPRWCFELSPDGITCSPDLWRGWK